MIINKFFPFLFILYSVCEVNGGEEEERSEAIPSSEFRVRSGISETFRKLHSQVLNDISQSDHAINDEIFIEFLATFKTCRKAFDDAADKVNYILDLLSENELSDEEEENIILSTNKSTHDDSVNDYELFDNLSLFYNLKRENVLQESYEKDAEKLFKTLKHACSSLPKALPNFSNRKSRSPQDIAQRLVTSLKRWAEKWVNSLDNKLDTFLVSCMNNKNCEHYFHKTIKKLIDIMEEHKLYLDKDSLSILQELQQFESCYPSLGALNDAQKIGLSIGNDFKEDDRSYHIANKINGIEFDDGSWINDHYGGEYGLNFLSKFFPGPPAAASSKVFIEIEESKIVQKVPKSFISVAFGSGLIQEGWKEVKTQREKFTTIASALSPTFLRIGGSAANFLTYDPTERSLLDLIAFQPTSRSARHPKGHTTQRKRKDSHVRTKGVENRFLHKTKGVRSQFLLRTNELTLENVDLEIDLQQRCLSQLYDYGKNFKNFTMQREDWRFLVELIKQLGWELVFDLNQFWRTPEGEWDPTNAELIIKDSYSSAIPIIWQLGNEPNAYHHKFNFSVSPGQAAKDYHVLKNLVGQQGLNRTGTRIIGPDVTRPKHISDQYGLKEDSVEFLKLFLEKGADQIDSITWHQYYINGRTATLEEFLSPDILNAFPRELSEIVSVRDQYASGKPIWITETASAWGGGAPGLSNRFAACFPWLDKLGAAAIGGASHVFRQTLYGGCYALLDDGLNPYPDFWVTVLHKRIVGQEVLLPRVRLAKATLRVYAHCFNSKHHLYKKGAIVVFGMNLSSKEEHLQLTKTSQKVSKKYLYELSAPAGDLRSRDILLNGRLLKLNEDGSVPDFEPLPVHTNDLYMTPWTLSFWVIRDADFQLCSQ